MLELDVLAWLVAQVDAADESEPVYVQNIASHAAINYLEQVRGDDVRCLLDPCP